MWKASLMKQRVLAVHKVQDERIINIKFLVAVQKLPESTFSPRADFIGYWLRFVNIRHTSTHIHRLTQGSASRPCVTAPP